MREPRLRRAAALQSVGPATMGDASGGRAQVRLALLGFGSVGQALLQLLQAKEHALAALGFRWMITAVMTDRRGLWLDPAGLPARELTSRVTSGDKWRHGAAKAGTPALQAILDALAADVVIETTPLDPRGGQPALDYFRLDLSAGVSVVTANKGPIGQAQLQGVAEADPWLDLDGWDAATKLSVLSHVLLGVRIPPDKIPRDPWPPPAGAATPHRQIASVTRQGPGAVRASVQWAELPPDDPLAAVRGMSTAVTLITDTLGELTITIKNPTTAQTAYGVLADLLAVSSTSAK